MTCDEAHPILHAYIDDELDIGGALQIEAHLNDCPKCRKELEAARAAGRMVAQPAIYYPASSELRDRLRRAIRSQIGKTETQPRPGFLTAWWKRPMAFSGVVAAMLLIICSIMFLLPAHASRGQIDDLVGSHVRSLEENHLMDVESTDQHTVKPWFAGKLEFSPPVIDLSPEGFALMGGRLDYLDQKNVAALIYRRNKHVINVFIWPGDTTPEVDAKQGFNLIRFECKGMTCWAVSDLNEAELQKFADLFTAQKSASTRS
jgi:anti-sigma factor RsiW